MGPDLIGLMPAEAAGRPKRLPERRWDAVLYVWTQTDTRRQKLLLLPLQLRLRPQPTVRSLLTPFEAREAVSARLALAETASAVN